MENILKVEPLNGVVVFAYTMTVTDPHTSDGVDAKLTTPLAAPVADRAVSHTIRDPELLGTDSSSLSKIICSSPMDGAVASVTDHTVA
jgi:hypothetical protein